MLVRRFPKLSETFILNQITGLIDAGHEVDIIAGARGADEKVHADVEKYGLIERTHYLDMPKNRFARIAEALGTIVDLRLWRNPGALVGSVNALRHGRRALSLGLMYTSVPFLTRPPYDIVHAQFGTLGSTAVALNRIRATQGNVAVSFRGSDLTVEEKTRGYARTFEDCQLLMPVCQSFADQLVAMGGDPRKIHVVHSGIEVSRFDFRVRHCDAGSPVLILSVARLEEKKGISYALQAVARLKSDGYDVRYTVVGDGELCQDLKLLVNELDLENEVQLVGSKTQAEVIEFLQGHHLFVTPSVTARSGDQEGIPNVIKEAMACGLPIVSTLHSGIPELVQDSVSGYLVPERDSAALAERLAHLIDHPELWESMGRAGREKVEAEFDTERVNHRLLELYEIAAAEAPPRERRQHRNGGTSEPL